MNNIQAKRALELLQVNIYINDAIGVFTKFNLTGCLSDPLHDRVDSLRRKFSQM